MVLLSGWVFVIKRARELPRFGQPVPTAWRDYKSDGAKCIIAQKNGGCEQPPLPVRVLHYTPIDAPPLRLSKVFWTFWAGCCCAGCGLLCQPFRQ